MKLVQFTKADGTPIFINSDRILAVFPDPGKNKDTTTWVEYGSTVGDKDELLQFGIEVRENYKDVLRVLTRAGIEVVADES